MRQIELDVEIVIPERVILGWVEHLKQRCRRVAAPVRTDLVDLIQHDHGIQSRQRANVRAAMAANLRLVAHAAKRHPDELPARGTRDRLADGRLAGAWRPDQGENDSRPPVLRHAALGPELADRQVLGDAAFHVVEALVVGVEDRSGMHWIQAFLRALRPRDRQQPIEIRADHRRLGV